MAVFSFPGLFISHVFYWTKQKKARSDKVDLPDLGEVIAYLDHCECAIEQLVETFPHAWSAVTSLDTRHNLALAISVL